MFGKTRYLYRLIFAFLLTSVLPLGLLSLFFGFFSADVLEDSYKRQSEVVIKNIVREVDSKLENLVHIVYTLSRDETLINNIESMDKTGTPGTGMLELYKKFYSSLSGNLDNAALYIISQTGLPLYSTLQIPSFYKEPPHDTLLGFFPEARRDPEKTIVSLNNYINSNGNLVSLSLCKSIQTENGVIVGFVVLDIYKNYLSMIADRINIGVFSELLLVDPTRNLVSDLYHPENDGNFSHLPFLTKVPSLSAGLLIEDGRMITYQPLLINNISVIGTVHLNVIMTNLAYLMRITLWILLVCLVLSVLLAILISRSISNPIKELILSMSKVERGDLNVRIESSREDEIGVLFKKFNIMTERIQKLMKKNLEEQSQLMTAERKALQAQINHHFLYNTLNTIKSISKLEGVESITTIVTQLGKLLRSTIENDEEFVTLGESLALVESYLAIQRIRFGDKIQTSIQAPKELYLHPFPKLILQPIIENAVIHGLEQKVGNGKIDLEIQRTDKEMVIIITDDGLGMDNPEQFIEGTDTNNIGLHNVHRRLQLYYGKNYGINVDSSHNNGTRVIIRVPLMEEFL